jgi:tetratricopeptide (TPR) repeat protein
MEGRTWTKLTAAALLAASVVGCKGTQKTLTSGMPTPAAAPSTGNFLSRMTQPKPVGAPKPQFMPVEVASDPAKKKSLKPETLAAFANAQVGAAFDFQEEGKVNANLDRMADEARLKFQKALEADPKNREALQGLARLYTRLGDRERAVAMLRTLQQHYPNDHKTAYELALTHARFEDWASAETACQQALQGDPENRSYLKTLGKLMARGGKMEQGFDVMVRVVPEAEARYTMAKLLADMEKPDLAHQQLQLAAKADPNYGPAQEWLAALNGREEPTGIQTVEARQP